MSLRIRLLLVLVGVALVALVATDAISYPMLRSFLYKQRDQSLAADYANIEQIWGGTNQVPTAQALLVTAPGTFAEVLRPDGTLISGPVAAYEDGGKYTPLLPQQITNLTATKGEGGWTATFNTTSTEAKGPWFRIRAWQLANGYILVLGAPVGRLAATLRHVLVWEIVLTAIAFVVVCLLGWWLTTVGLRPLKGIQQTADAIANGEFEQRVPGDDRKTEVGRLAKALNVMLTRIQSAFTQRDATEAELRASDARLRRFVADASHELRTPVAAVSAYAELFERGAGSSPDDLRRVMSGIRSETARMGRLVEDLLLLARLDEGRPLERKPVELVRLASDAAQASGSIGPEWPVRLEAANPVEVVGDEARLRQVLDNLLANVRAHTPAGTRATIRVKELEGTVIVEVEDEGPGLKPEEAEHVFERFYRTDRSRTRDTGGSGLGLAIVAAIVAAHGGTATAQTGADGGALFVVRLPAAPSALS